MTRVSRCLATCGLFIAAAVFLCAGPPAEAQQATAGSAPALQTTQALTPVSSARVDSSDAALYGATTGGAAGGYNPASQLDLFYNYYVGTNGLGVPAGMYPAPRPTPWTVGQVYYTYQALLPHEYMYPHYRQYYTYYGHYHGYGSVRGHASVNRTTVRYQRGSIRPTYCPRLRPPRVPHAPVQGCGHSVPCY